MEAIIPQKIQI